MITTDIVVVLMLAVAIVSAVVAVLLDRRFVQSKQYREWMDENERLIAELESKAAQAQLLANTVAGQLLALGIKLPGADNGQQ